MFGKAAAPAPSGKSAVSPFGAKPSAKKPGNPASDKLAMMIKGLGKSGC